jgi:hypothetical protein
MPSAKSATAFTACTTKVIGHLFIVTEDGSGSSYLSTHITNGSFSCTRNTIGTWTKIFYNRISSSFYSKIPATFKMTSFAEVHPLILPVNFTPINFGNFSSQGRPAITSHASAPPTPMAHHTESASIHCVTIGTNHHRTWKCIIF